MAEMFRAREAFAYTDKDGAVRVISPGILMSDSDPGYRGRERLFEPVHVSVEKAEARRTGRVEDTSAEPNTKRSVSTAHPKAEQVDKPDEKPVEKPVYGETSPPKPGARRGPKAGQ